jgi:pSer/pThr/pTyr-binding forkhead associated (FHA) protein
LRSSHASRHHARILTDDRYTYIEDLDSANGIMVNSERVTRQQLHSGDIINAGRIQIKYIDLMEGSAGEGQA